MTPLRPPAGASRRSGWGGRCCGSLPAAETDAAAAAGVDLYPNPVLLPQEEPLQEPAVGPGKGASTRRMGGDPGPSGIVVAVLDTGTDLEHPELAPRLWDNPGEVPGNGADDDGNGFIDDIHGWDFRDGDKPARRSRVPRDDDERGGGGRHRRPGCGRGGPGCAADADRGCATTVCPDADVIAALAYAVDNGADVVNISLGRAPLGDDIDAPLRQAVQAAGDAGVLVVAAAGNQATDADENPLVPAAFSGNTIVSVAATDPDDGLASYLQLG